MSGSTPPTLRPLLVVLFTFAFILNWVWEMVQMPAYVKPAGDSWRALVLICTAAALGDALLALGLYALVALVIRRPRWSVQAGWKGYAIISLAGAASAVVIERAALALGLWSYTGRMPLVPVLGTGLLPLLQLALLMPAPLWVAAWWIRRSGEAL